MPERNIEQNESGDNLDQQVEKEANNTMMDEINSSRLNEAPKRGGERPEPSSLEFTPLY